MPLAQALKFRSNSSLVLILSTLVTFFDKKPKILIILGSFSFSAYEGAGPPTMVEMTSDKFSAALLFTLSLKSGEISFLYIFSSIHYFLLFPFLLCLWDGRELWLWHRKTRSPCQFLSVLWIHLLKDLADYP